jgi:peroxiredoxin Q/BCP
LEAVEFNQLLPEFKKIGVKVVAVSVDSLERLERFRNKYSLDFPLISDSDRALGDTYGTLKAPGGSHERDTVVISPEGTILAAYQRARAAGHAASVLAAVKDLRGQGSL